ncbi:MAG: hypothetical protein A2086_17340 [Spirochaetes bacterium GWD1_27_9]|nr:MAG: hypothetical protein A2Z98_16725 [Spirochaetes bacterium GWB1_27_13]OHD42986.1 MAG: hypothetical protein A2086_17340 [Spirochaetes bacterium GWD1_27_9]
MATKIYYFTSTGNSLAVAKEFKNKLNDAELIPIAKLINEKEIIIDCDNFGIICPLFYLSYPRLVLDFISKIKIVKCDYIFTVLTRGFKGMGGAIGYLDNLLKKKGTKLNFGTYIDMPNNDVVLFDIQPKEIQQNLLNNSKISIEKSINMVKNRKNSKKLELLGFLRPIRQKVYLDKLKYGYKNFYVTDDCNYCGLCSNICPVNNISIKNQKPIWNNLCEECEGCINICPKKAIQYTPKTITKGRYKHPNLKIDDLINQKI